MMGVVQWQNLCLNILGENASQFGAFHGSEEATSVTNEKNATLIIIRCSRVTFSCIAYLVDIAHQWKVKHIVKVRSRHILRRHRYRMHLLVWYWHCQVCSPSSSCDLDRMQPSQMPLHFAFQKHLSGNLCDWFFYAGGCHWSSAPLRLHEFVDP